MNPLANNGYKEFMSLILTGITAYEFWRSAISHDTPEFGEVSKQSYFALFKHESARPVIDPLKRIDGSIGDLHILVGSAKDRIRIPGITCHYCTNPNQLPAGSIYQISRDLFVVSPELCLVQLAATLPFLETVRVGTDLCSRYAIGLFNKMDLVEIAPATSHDTIQRYISLLPTGMRGLEKARRATRYIHDGSRSPRETSLSILMALPTRMGGFQMPAFELNHRIDLDDKLAALTRRRYFEFDVFFIGQNRAFEYESDIHHDSLIQLSFDYEKISALQTKGYIVTPISSWQMGSFEAFEKLMVSTKLQLGQRDRCGEKLSALRRQTHYDVLERERINRSSTPLAETTRWRFLLSLM